MAARTDLKVVHSNIAMGMVELVLTVGLMRKDPGQDGVGGGEQQGGKTLQAVEGPTGRLIW